MARSCKLIHISDAQGEFAAAKLVLAERIAHAICCQMGRPPTATNMLCSWCHREMEGPWGASGWAEKRPMCFQGSDGSAKLPEGQHEQDAGFTDFTFELHLQHLITDI